MKHKVSALNGTAPNGPSFNAEPATETIRRGYRHWSKIGNEELLEMVRRAMEGRPPSLGELRKADQSLANEVNKRGLAGELGLSVRTFRSWKSMGDAEFIAAANLKIADGKVPNKTTLWRIDAGLADRIRDRGLWDKIEYYNGPGAAVCEKRKAKALQKKPQAKAVEDEEGPQYTKEEILVLAQAMIDDVELQNIGEIEILDWELAQMIRLLGAEGDLVFKTSPPKADEKKPEGIDRNAGPEQLRKTELIGREIDEEMMCRLILACCFRIGTANPYVGNHRCIMPKLYSALKTKLSGSHEKLFYRCWGRMVAEHVILYNGNRTAASIELYGNPANESVARAVVWARDGRRTSSLEADAHV